MNQGLEEALTRLTISNISTTHHKKKRIQRIDDLPSQFPHYKVCILHLSSSLGSLLSLLDCPKWGAFFKKLSTLVPTPLKEHMCSKSLSTFPSFEFPPVLIGPCKLL